MTGPSPTPAVDRLLQRAAILGWRLGLGWLLGRRRLLITTTQPGEGRLRHSVARYGFAGGNFYVPAPPTASWRGDLETKPQATVQAAPGPKGVRGRPVVDPDEVALARTVLARETGLPAGSLPAAASIVVFEPTGERVPEMLPPDLAWVWPAVGVAAAAFLRLGPGRVRPGS